ncbi:MAG: hypothetical protein JEZ08_16370 [Clostridiales bacterium]|nr:hypothetical protein [Clostridiales bacterium]
MFYVTLRNKTTGEVISTEEHGVVAELYINADGSYELTEVGTITESNSSFTTDTSEKYFNAEDYDVIDVQFDLPEADRNFLLSKDEITRELKPLLSDAANVYHFDQLSIDSVNGFLVTELTKDEEQELHSALLEMSFVTHIYPRGHFKADQQNWNVSFVEEEHKSVTAIPLERKEDTVTMK